MNQIEYNQATGQPALHAGGLEYDPSEGQAIVVIPVNDREAVATMKVGQLLQLVPDPRKSEDPKQVETDPTLRAYAALRREVQRAVQGAKAKNAVAFGRYIVEGIRGERPWVAPAITLYHPLPLQPVRLPNGVPGLVLPYGDFFVAIDGETQRLAWQYAAHDYPPAMDRRVKVVIHHGKSEIEARQGFYDLNTREVKPNAAVAIAMDSMDVATKITRRVMEESLVLEGGSLVNLQRRQLRRADKELMTISGLRTGIVTTILGVAGLQIGSRPVDPTHPALEGIELEQLADAVVDVWTAMLEELEDELKPERRTVSVVSAPAILAGLGVLAHHAVPKPPRRDGVDSWTVEEVIKHLHGVNWDRTTVREGGGATIKSSPWEGIAGKFTPAGSFSLGGPKEVGYAVADALENVNDEPGRKIRGRD